VIFRFPHSIKPTVYEQASATKINDRQQQILEVLASGVQLRVKEIQDKMEKKFSERTLHRDLLVLKKMKLVNTIGHTHKAVWFIEK